MAASQGLLPVPQPLEIHDSQAAEKWKRFKSAWANYALAIGLDEKTQKVQVATLKLLRKANLTLLDIDDICRSHEATSTQMKKVEEMPGTVNAVDCSRDRTANKEPPRMTDHRECLNCGRKHDFSKRENCPAFGKTCNKCRKPNHFAVKCRSQRS